MIRWPDFEHWQRLIPELRGRKGLRIGAIASISRPVDSSLIFATQLNEQSLAKVLNCSGCLVLLRDGVQDLARPLEDVHGIAFSDDPRYQFASLLDGLWDAGTWRGGFSWDSTRGVSIGRGVKLDSTAVIEPGVTISDGCEIMAGSYIMSGAKIGPNVHIGRRTVIRENAVIGGYGFGFARSEGKPSLRIPHIGGVRIGDDVEIGALTTVCSGTLDPTIVEDRVKTDDHVHIAHNCHIAVDVIVCAGVCLAGGCRIGAGTWLGPNCCTREKTVIGAHCFIGVGAVVTRAIDDDKRAFGNPGAHLLRVYPKTA